MKDLQRQRVGGARLHRCCRPHFHWKAALLLRSWWLLWHGRGTSHLPCLYMTEKMLQNLFPLESTWPLRRRTAIGDKNWNSLVNFHSVLCQKSHQQSLVFNCRLSIYHSWSRNNTVCLGPRAREQSNIIVEVSFAWGDRTQNSYKETMLGGESTSCGSSWVVIATPLTYLRKAFAWQIFWITISACLSSSRSKILSAVACIGLLLTSRNSRLAGLLAMDSSHSNDSQIRSHKVTGALSCINA